MSTDEPYYWLPEWWGWMEDWSSCIACMQYNHSRCLSCEIPPGLMALACLVGGGTAVATGGMRGNVGIANQRQARAAGDLTPMIQAARSGQATTPVPPPPVPQARTAATARRRSPA